MQLTEIAQSNIGSASDNHWQSNGLTSCPYCSFLADTSHSDRKRDFYKTHSSLEKASFCPAKKICLHHNGVYDSFYSFVYIRSVSFIIYYSRFLLYYMLYNERTLTYGIIIFIIVWYTHISRSSNFS